MELVATGKAKTEEVAVAAYSGLAKDVVALVLLAVLPALFFWRFFTSNSADSVTLPSGDLINLNYPYRLFETRELLQGRLPLWNPYVFSGASSLGDIQYGIFYPLNLACSLLLGRDGFPPVDLAVQIALHFSLASIFTYLFGRRIFGSRTGAFVSALVFTYSGYLTSYPVHQIMILETSIWLPLILLFLDKGITGRSPSSFALAGVFTATAILAGHPQTLMYVLIAALAYAVFRIAVGVVKRRPMLAGDWRMSSDRVDLRIVIPGMVVFLLLSVGLSAIQLLPSYEHLQLTERTATSYEFVERGFLLRELVGLLFPTLSGGKQMYIGILSLLLAFIAFLSQRERHPKVFWLVLSLFALVLSFGGQTFLHSFAYLIFPGFKFFRDQERTVFLFAFGMAVLSGYGARAVCEELKRADMANEIRRRLVEQTKLARWVGFLIAAFALAAFLNYVGAAGEQKKPLGELSDRAFFTLLIFGVSIAAIYLAARQTLKSLLSTALLVAIIAFDLFSTNWLNNVELPKPMEIYPTTKTITAIKSDTSETFRISSEGLLPGHGNAGAVYEIEDIVGDSPLELHQHLAFEKNVDEIRRWQLLNVKYVLTRRKIDDGRLIPVGQEDQINTYELAPNLRLPRAFTVHKAIIAPSEDEALRLTKAIDPRTEVVLAKDPKLTLPDQSSVGSTVTVVERNSNRIKLNTSSRDNGILVLSEAFYPGWKALVDDRPVEILRADYLLRAIPLEKGDHSVELTFDPSSLSSGMRISAVSAGIALVIIIASAILALVSRIRGQLE